MPISPKQNISRRFSVAIISVVTVFLVCFAVIAVWDSSISLEGELRDRVSLASTLTQIGISEPLWNINTTLRL